MHSVKCFYCTKYFDRDSEPTVAVKGRRYAHEKCYNAEQINNSENSTKTTILSSTQVSKCSSCSKPTSTLKRVCTSFLF